MAATFSVKIDWNGDGDFSDTGEDVSSRVITKRSPLVTRAGRDQARALGKPTAGTGELELNNASKDYSPDYASSPLFGNVLPGRDVLVQAVLSAVTYTIIRAKTDDFKVKPRKEDRSVKVSLIDGIGLLKDVSLTTGLYRGIRTGTAIGYILDAIGWSSSLRDLDPGASVLPYWWLDDTDAFEAMQDLIDSEGPPSIFYIDQSGNFVFRDRHHRLLDSACLTSQSTWSGTGSEPIISEDMDYNNAWKEIVNSVTFVVPLRTIQGELSDVWSSSSTITISSGETIVITARSSNPFVGALTPIAGTDYTLVSGTVSVVMNRTDGQAVSISISASGGPAIVQDLKLRAYAIESSASINVMVEDTVSIGKYGRRSGSGLESPKWVNAHDALAVAELVVGKRADRLPTITVTMQGSNDTKLLQQLSRVFSDRITLVETETGINGDCFIEQISHQISEGSKLLTTQFGLEKAPDENTNVFTFDVAGKGFDDGLFARMGQDDSDTIFILDGGAGHRFDEGVFAH